MKGWVDLVMNWCYTKMAIGARNNRPPICTLYLVIRPVIYKKIIKIAWLVSMEDIVSRSSVVLKILEIAKFYWLIGLYGAQRAKKHHCAEFRLKQSLHCGNIAIFWFLARDVIYTSCAYMLRCQCPSVCPSVCDGSALALIMTIVA